MKESLGVARKLPTSGRQKRPVDCPDTGCGAPLQLPYLCHACGSLMRPPPGLDHFARFGLPASMDLDLAALESSYMDLCRRMHPDRMIAKDTTTQSRALMLSSALNEAYAQLKDERSRAEHLLRLKGGKTADEDKRTPQAFLIEMLDLREEVEAAQASGDEAALEPFRARADREQTRLLARVRELFADPAFPTPELLDAIRLELNVVKYWVTLLDDLAGRRAG